MNIVNRNIYGGGPKMFRCKGLFFVSKNENLNGKEIVRMCCKALWLCRQFRESEAKSIYAYLVLTYTECGLDYMGYESDWDSAETDFAYYCENEFVDERVASMLDIATAHTTHRQKKERFARTSVEDLRMTRMMALIMDLGRDFEAYIEARFSQEYERHLPKP